MNPLLVLIIIIILVLCFILKHKGSNGSEIELIVEENYLLILKLAEKQALIESYVNLDIEEGGHYPKFYNKKHIDIVKSAIRLYLLKNKGLKSISEITIFNDYQKQEILKICSQELNKS